MKGFMRSLRSWSLPGALNEHPWPAWSFYRHFKGPTIASLKVDLDSEDFGRSWSSFGCFGSYGYYHLNALGKQVMFVYSELKIMENGRDMAISDFEFHGIF